MKNVVNMKKQQARSITLDDLLAKMKEEVWYTRDECAVLIGAGMAATRRLVAYGLARGQLVQNCNIGGRKNKPVDDHPERMALPRQKLSGIHVYDASFQSLMQLRSIAEGMDRGM